MAGALAREAQVRWLSSSRTGGPFLARVGSFGPPVMHVNQGTEIGITVSPHTVHSAQNTEDELFTSIAQKRGSG